jgi:threonyl-tRNA synthetase
LKRQNVAITENGKGIRIICFSQKVGQGCLYGLKELLRERLEQFLKSTRKAGYEQVITPHIGQKELYVTSGHYANMEQIAFNQSLPHMKGEEFY